MKNKMIKRTPRYRYKIRKAITNNKTGDNFVVTVPANIASRFEGVYLYLITTPIGIIYESGCAPVLR